MGKLVDTQDSIQPLLTAQEIQSRVREMGTAITNDYAGRSLVLLSVLKGSFVFVADLARSVDLPLRVEFLGVQSYGDDTRSSGVVRITQDLTHPIERQDVLIVEDIVDTGLTLSYIIEQLRARGPASLKVCALLHKPSRMKKMVNIDYLGFSVADVFVVGYGLDHAGRYRNLPFIGVLSGAEPAPLRSDK
ncbi:MAG TPA: hypoxanthine phosphoribosyltransferase [Polyangiaceae bacterium]|jgi:hypoxanthine phosphoribosyltransferase